MSEPRLLDPAEIALDASARLRREVGLLAGRLETLVSRLATGGPELAGARAFLRSLAEQAEAAVEPWRRGGGPVEDPIERLVLAYRFTSLDRELLLLAGMAEEHEGLASTLAMLHPHGEPRPTVGVAAQLLAPGADDRHELRVTLERGGAVRSGALRVTGDGPFYNRSIELAPRLWSVLHGVDAWPAEIEPLPAPTLVAEVGDWGDPAEIARASLALREIGARTVLFTADDLEVAMARAVALARAAGVGYVCFDLPPRDREPLLAVHSVARGTVPIVRIAAGDGPAARPPRVLAELPSPLVLCARPGAVPPQGARPVVEIAVGPLSLTARAALWRRLLPDLGDEADRLGAVYRLEAGAACEVAIDVRDHADSTGEAPGPRDVARSVRSRAGAISTAGVSLRRPTAAWDDLVLPPDRLSQLGEAVDRLRHQTRVLESWGFLRDRPGARGVRILFSGPPGTGKTLAAEVLAHTLGVDLLVVDLSRVVSKWLGETEKNLAEVFDAAERTQAVLLFDEADALFGRRTEVSDAHDRYANLETAYLLTRLERYEGLGVLATNLPANLDTAFIRRMEFVVEFEEPGIAERREIWRRHFPPLAPLADGLDLDELARLFPVSGAVIRNAAVSAAFRAAAERAQIDRDRLMRALRREYQKAGRAFPGVPSALSDA